MQPTPTPQPPPAPAAGSRPRLADHDTPFLGYGVGLRREHFDEIFDQRDRIDWLEILGDNFAAFGGRPRAVLDRAAKLWPLALHGVGLNIGGLEDLDQDYLDALLGLVDRYDMRWFSDHLCYSAGFGVEYYDLIPLPFTEEALEHVVRRVHQVQERTRVPFLLENPSYYVAFAGSELGEAEFLSEVVRRSGCGLLLDVNNVYVNAMNHGYDARTFIASLPLDRVGQIHLAGHTVEDDVIIDTHGAPIIDPVFDLYAYTLRLTGPVSTLLERDNAIPPLAELAAENDRIRALGESVLGKVATWRP